MSMRKTLDRSTAIGHRPVDGRLQVDDPPARFADPGLDGESGASAPPDNVPTEAKVPQVPAEQVHPDNIATGEATPIETGPIIELSDTAYAAGNACVQCGLCLPACPTYLETGNEADSPRGRIRQMLGLHDGDVPYTAAGQEHLDRCLDCRACETACPSGVIYHRLIEDARHRLQERQASRTGGLDRKTRFERWIFYNILTQPNRLRIALLPARLLQKVGLWSLFRFIGLPRLLPGMLRRMERMLPAGGPIWPRGLPPHSRSGGIDMVVTMLNPAAGDVNKPRALVGFFEGCIAAVLNADVHRKAAELMCAAGADVISPPDQACCGAIHLHNNDPELAADLARRNIDTYMPEDAPELDWIVTCTAGDGAMLRQYGELLADDPVYAERARRFSEKVRDISEVLVELGLPRMKQRLMGCVTYHDACHLAHGQKVTSAPRRLLQSIPGLELVELPESDTCCGAAGTYNLTQPEMAGALARRKLNRIAETNCQHVASGNIGCSLHLSAEAEDAGRPVKFVHPVELVHAAVFGEG
jgi:glycolate oxidase iron-sulfur subunit